ncbi:SDR family NAD(P)-dependent oxidoreductase [Eubacterium barkeri]|uniref:NAD(P)-dependent dehydrogenase, short-chain alcohol dehydrogenase family n=1 Tax=Eubacterium barkeri TaxID=1528 RepID=A0A1H3F914_EUBBA|nr:SDR family oxidoreductase [Eubacterium barkeri]SDX87486.1 NAD(P)-dependent dehydrogenase, short-chain alcohol dehydrogenase family [Eubacterium barkeri]
MKKVAVVTGGSEGIGFSIAEKFIKEGFAVVILSRREGEGKEAERKLNQKGEAKWIKASVDNEEDCQNVATIIKETYGAVDVLVNNAGVTGTRVDFFDLDMKEVAKTININVLGTIQMMKYIAPLMTERKGVIVNIGSLCGYLVNTESIAYHASKGAVRLVTQTAAKELAQYGIRVVSVAPAWVATQMCQSVLDADPEAEEHGKSLHMMHKILTPAQIAGVVYLATTEDASAINGTTIMADDGYTAFKL